MNTENQVLMLYIHTEKNFEIYLYYAVLYIYGWFFVNDMLEVYQII